MCIACYQLADYQCNDNVYYLGNNLEDLDYRDDSIIIQPSPNEFKLRSLLPGRAYNHRLRIRDHRFLNSSKIREFYDIFKIR